MSDYTDPAWDEYLSTGEDPTGGELEGNEEYTCEPEPNWYDWHNQHLRNHHHALADAEACAYIAMTV